MDKLFISFSGGRTSGYMTKRLVDEYSSKYEPVILFANTGQEKEETLEFVNQCANEFNWNVIWIEPIVYHGVTKGCGHRVVTFETACRDGAVFEDVIRKYGIPNTTWPHCTRELKLNPMLSYIKSIGWKKGEYLTAVGIREDESRRCAKDAKHRGIIYPLVDWFPTDKQDVSEWWEGQSFNLDLEEHQGNCSWCWKKSLRKHMRLIDESPEIFDFPRLMEEKHGMAGYNKDDKKRVFFRQHMSTDKLFELAIELKREESKQGSFDLDITSGCSESCEVYS